MGKDFPWLEIKICPCCSGKIWKHGFVSAWFHGFDQAIFIRRFRCIDCKKVFRVRPSSHWSRFQYSKKTIKTCLSYRVFKKLWLPAIKKRNQKIWMFRLKQKIKIFLGMNYGKDVMTAFKDLLQKGMIPVSCSSNPVSNSFIIEPTV